MTSELTSNNPGEGSADSPQRRKFLTDGSLAMLGASSVGGLLAGMSSQAAADGNHAGSARPAAAQADIVALDAVALSAAIKARQVSCRETMQAYLRQIARINPSVNAIVSLQDSDYLLKQAERCDRQLARGEYMGWLHGMPHAVKDLAETAGIRTTFGSPLFKDHVPRQDDILVERIKRHGAIIIGKTNTPEFGLGSNTYNPNFGVTRNAYDQSRVAGGSSGGAAVALALKMVPVADGSDMMGSLRNPAAFNNIYGFRPTVGVVPAGPDPELFLGQLATDGAMGRTVTDLAMLLATEAGYDARAPLSIQENPAGFTQSLKRDFRGTRVGWLGDFNGYLPMAEGILAMCRTSFATLEALGCKVDEATLDFAPERMWETWLTLRHSSLAGGLGDSYLDPAKRALMKPELIWEIEGGMKLRVTDFYRASKARSALYQAFNKMFMQFDYVLLPTAQIFPFSIDEHWPKRIANRNMDTYHRWMEVVIAASLTGSPAVSVPLGFGAQGLPMGLQIIGRRGADLAVLQLAYAYEQATQWVQRRPPPLLGI
ncbi:amidase [Collimonas sp.]|jgi:amidase|uniref:amidase n=1 Tax=Collimonas sp. TaxID=1963772 RepID=UPI002C3E4DA6|nr:amidase [Collimonas sp.]HWX03824.1 amidase [Collimonas sp.]